MKADVLIVSSNRDDRGFVIPTVDLPEIRKRWELDIGLATLFRHFGLQHPKAMDLVLLASSCYLLDKVVSRSTGPDNWTRTFELSLPVSDPATWNAVAGSLSQTLEFLTGDFWSFSFKPLTAQVLRRPTGSRLRTIRYRRGQEHAVCLFSGGLDSLSGVLDLLASSPTKHLFLLGHYDLGPARETQRKLYDSLEPTYGERTTLVHVRAAHRPLGADESSMRSRSLVFLALGMYAASGLGPHVPLYAHENGFVALNLPLTPSRVGSCSTRTMHPFFLEQLAGVLSAVGLQNPILNPYAAKTKGECITESLASALLQTVADQSQSCAHPGRRQNWDRTSAINCGYCYPCLIRRAGMHAAGLDDGNEYGIDVCAGELRPGDEMDSAADLRALLDFVRQDWSLTELRKEIVKVALIDNVPAQAAMANRGIAEIRRLFAEKGNRELRAAIGAWPQRHD
ncbi:MAG: hypothetical protein IT318_26520 [Anaerolineales bacterium]|nr:hypothetical protein [Anaerolineales bacterium]